MSSTLSEFVKNCSQKICKEVFDNRSSNNKNENFCGSVPANTQRKFSTIWNLTNFGKSTIGGSVVASSSSSSSPATNQTTATGATKDVRSISTISCSIEANAAAAAAAFNTANATATTSQKQNPSFVVNMTSSTSAPSFQQQSAKEQEADYDPYKNRKVNHPTSFNDTLLHLLKGSLGTGILFMPNAFTHSGYVLGIVGTLLIGLICTYCIHMLVAAQYELCRRKRIPSLSYTGTAEASFKQGPLLFQALAPYTVHIINVFLLMYQLGTCCVYVAFIAENVKKVGDLYYPHIGLQLYMCLFLVPLLLLSCVKNLKKLTPISSFANFLTTISYTMIVYYLFCESPTLENREAISSKVETYPLFFGTVLFALEAIGMMLPLENEMKHPKKFSSRFGVLNIGMISIIFMYIGMGMLGYMAYGDKVNDSITMSLDISVKNVGGQIVLLLLALSIFFTYAIQFYVAIKIVWDEYIGPKFDKNPNQNLYQYVVRCFLVLLTFSVAALCPQIELFVSLVGAFCLSALGIGIPALIELSAYWYQRVGLDFSLMLAKNLFLVIFCIVGLITGTYVSLEKIAHEFLKNEQNP